MIARGESVYAVLNLYPYNSGHLMICPYRHVADYPDLSDPASSAIADRRTAQGTGTLNHCSRHSRNEEGFNSGAKG